MQNDNKILISLTTAIIIAVCIGALILGIICFFIFGNKNSALNTNTSNPSQNEVASNGSTNTNNQVNTNNNNNVQNSNNTSSVSAKKTTKSNPASVGEWVLASKYSSEGYVDVPTRVINITRGTSATKKYENYCNNGYIYKYQEPKEGMEWAIIEYEVNLTSFSTNTTVSLDRKITGTDDNTSIKYNNATYIVTTSNMTSGSTKSEIAKAKFATQLPIECTDYLIALGSSSDNQSFIQGK